MQWILKKNLCWKWWIVKIISLIYILVSCTDSKDYEGTIDQDVALDAAKEKEVKDGNPVSDSMITTGTIHCKERNDI